MSFSIVLGGALVVHSKYNEFEFVQQMIRSQAQLLHNQPRLLVDAITLFSEQLKDKTLKKQAIEEIGVIALVLTPTKIKNELIPLLIKSFVQETLEIRLAIIKSFAVLIAYLKSGQNCFAILQFMIDVLCVFNEDQIRKEAYLVLQKVLQFMDVRKHQGEILKVVRLLGKQVEKNIRQLVLKLIRYLYLVVQNEHEAELVQLIKQYLQNQEGQIILAHELSQFIKCMPPFPQTEIHAIIRCLLQTKSAKPRTKLIRPIIMLTKMLSEVTTQQYFLTLLKDTNSDVLASIILQVKQIVEVFSSKLSLQLLELIDKYQSHDNTIKTAILQIIEHIPLTQVRRNYILNEKNFKYLNLAKTMANSLCKIHDIDALKYIIDNSDSQFKNKLFPKLPSTSEIHIKLLDSIFSQKNWRNKLNVLQNIEKRLQNEENVEILIPKLLEQLGDKIAVFRMATIKLIAVIVKNRKISLQTINKQLKKSFSSRNWFERQSVLILLLQIASYYCKLQQSDKSIIQIYLRQAFQERIQNMLEIAKQIRVKCV